MLLGSYKLPIRGDVYVELRDMRTNEVKKKAICRNLLTTNGAIELAKIILSTATGTRPTTMGIGSATTTPAASQTALASLLAYATLTGVSRSNNQNTYQTTFGTGVGTGNVEEGGLFTASGGTMISRFLTGTFSKGASDSLTVSWRLTFGTT